MSNFFGTVNTKGSQTYDAPVYEGHIEPTGTALMEIATESLRDGLAIQAALHIADATIEYKAVHESASAAEIVLEGVLGSTVGKIKEGLKKLWAKMKAWFKSVGKSFQLMFTSGKDFVKKYKKEIEEKRASGFEYSGYAWSIAEGNNKAKAAMDGIEGVIGDVAGKASSISAGMDTSKLASEYTLSEVKEKIVNSLASKVGVSGSNLDMSDIKEALFKAYRGGSDEKEELKEFAKVNRGTLIALIEKVDTNKKFVDEAEKIVDKQFAESIKALDKLETELAKASNESYGDKESSAGNRSKITSFASMVGNATRYAQSLNSAIASTAVESIKASAKEAESTLKSFIRFKGVKESFEGDHEDGAEGVMESLIGSVKL